MANAAPALLNLGSLSSTGRTVREYESIAGSFSKHFFHNDQQQAAADIRWQTLYQRCWIWVHYPALVDRCESTSRLQVHSLSTRKLVQSNESVANVEEHLKMWKGDRDVKSVQRLSNRQHLHDYLGRKAELPVRGESAAHRRITEEADLEIRRWEQKSSEIALYETRRELESQRLELHQANQWGDQARKEKRQD